MSVTATAAMAASQDTAIRAYDEFRGQLDDLRAANDSASFDYESPKGNRAARSHIHALRAVKGAVEKARKAEKAASLEYGRKVDAEAKEIVSEIDRMIDVHAEPLRQIEGREATRIGALRDRLARISDAASPVDADGDSWGSNYLIAKLAEVREIALDDSWQEFIGDAGKAKDAAVTALERHVEAAKKREAEAAELDRLRQEQAEAARQAEQRRIEEAAAAKERSEAERRAREEREAHERAMREAEERAAHERAEAERKLREQQEAAKRRELEIRLEAERKERERLAAEDTARRDREARERDEANRAAVHKAIAGAIVSTAGVDADVATKIARAIASGAIPRVTINY